MTRYNAEYIALQLGRAKRSGKGWAACCPAHDDTNPSLALDDNPNGGALVYCRTGCTQEDVVRALKARGLWDDNVSSQTRASSPRDSGAITKKRKPQVADAAPHDMPPPNFVELLGWEPTSTYVYKNAEGQVLHYIARRDDGKGGKGIRPVRPALVDGKWRWEVGAVPEPRPLYGLDHIAARLDAPVLLVEGEKTADAAENLFPDHVSVTWSGGAGAVNKADWMPLAGRAVVIWPDNDKAGKDAVELLRKQLTDVGASVKLVRLPRGLPSGWDLADDLPANIDVKKLLQSAKQADGQLRPLIETAVALLEKDLPPREYLIEPWLPKGGLAMVFAERGLGKTWFAMSLGLALVKGHKSFLGWNLPAARNVLYIDGEMALVDLQARLKALEPFPSKNFHLLSSESLYQHDTTLNINDVNDQERILAAIDVMERGAIVQTSS